MMWKDYSIHDKFIVDRHLKDGSIFISLQTEKVYLVKGIYSSIREMLEGLPMPQVVMATLIPFKDAIIHDGIVMPYGVTLGKNMSDQSKEIYRSAKTNNEIIKSVTQEKPQQSLRFFYLNYSVNSNNCTQYRKILVTAHRQVFSEPKIPYESLSCAVLGNFACGSIAKNSYSSHTCELQQILCVTPCFFVV